MITYGTRRLTRALAAAALTLAAGCQVLGGIDDTQVGGGPADAGSDAPRPPEVPIVSIEELRALGDGPANVALQDVVVTYIGVKDTSSTVVFVQDEVFGPAIQVFFGPTPPGLVVGNRISIHARNLGTFQGSRQIDQFEVFANDGGQLNVRLQLAQDLSAGNGRPPGPEDDSELIVLNAARVVSVTPDGFNYTIEYGPQTAPVRATMFSEGAQKLGLCPGATFDVLAVVTLFQGNFQIRAFNVEDFTPRGPVCPNPVAGP